MRNKLVVHSIFFVLGFGAVFSLAGILIETMLMGASLTVKRYLSYVGGVIIIAFGLYLIGLLKLPFLDTEKRMTAKQTRYAYLSSFLFGAAFGAGWSPCVGAILGAILTLATVSPVGAFSLLLAYSLGLGIPFVIAAFFAQKSATLLRKLHKHLRIIQMSFGVLLLILGALILTNSLESVAQMGFAFEFFSRIDVALSSYSLGVGVAFLAGLASFLSPCILPLLPAYLAYLGGLGVSKQ